MQCKRKDKVLMLFLFLSMVFGYFNCTMVKANEIPKLRLVEMDHSPITEGDKITFYLKAGFDDIDLSQGGKVQYKIFYNKNNEKKLTELTDGYSEAVSPYELVKITPKKTLKPGDYKISVFLKRAGEKGAKSNEVTDYDDLTTADLTYISKKEKVDLNGQLNIQGKILENTNNDVAIALYKDNSIKSGSDNNIISAKMKNRNSKYTIIDLCENGKKRFSKAVNYKAFSKLKDEYSASLTKLGEDDYISPLTKNGDKIIVKLYDDEDNEIAIIENVIIGEDSSGKVADVRNIIQLLLTDSGKKKYSKAFSYEILNSKANDQFVDSKTGIVKGFNSRFPISSRAELGQKVSVFPGKEYGDVISIRLLDKSKEEIDVIENVLLQYTPKNIELMNKYDAKTNSNKNTSSNDLITTKIQQEDYYTNVTLFLTEAGKEKYKNVTKFEIFHNRTGTSLSDIENIGEKNAVLPAIEIGEKVTVKLYDDDSNVLYTIKDYAAKNTSANIGNEFDVTPLVNKSNSKSKAASICSQDIFTLGQNVKISGIKGLDKDNYQYKLQYYNIEENMWFTNNKDFVNEINWIPTESGRYILKVSIKPKNSKSKYEMWKIKAVEVNPCNDSLLAYSKDFIYYGNLENNCKLYKTSLDGSINKKMCDDSISRLNIQDDWIYYERSQDNKFYKIKTDGSKKQEIKDDAEKLICYMNDLLCVPQITLPSDLEDIDFGNVFIRNYFHEDLFNINGEVVYYDKSKKKVDSMDFNIKEIKAAENDFSTYYPKDIKNFVYLGTVIKSFKGEKTFSENKNDLNGMINNPNYYKEIDILSSKEFIDSRLKNNKLIRENTIKEIEARKEREKKRREDEKIKAKEDLKKELVANGNVPIKFMDYGVYRDVISFPYLSVSYKNLSDKKIDAFEISFKCYDSYGKPVNEYLGSNNYVTELIQIGSLGSGLTSNFSVDLMFYYNTTKIEDLKITSVHFEDGEVWKP